MDKMVKLGEIYEKPSHDEKQEGKMTASEETPVEQALSKSASIDVFDLEEAFAMIDKIDDAQQLVEMRKSIRDSRYTKMFWEQWEIALEGETEVERARAKLKCNMITKKYAASIGVNRKVNRFTTPHGLAGIHISTGATVGTGCTIFQHVVIGSNTLMDSKSHGFPVVGNDVYIGAGAMIIGNVRVGNNVRIGANCIVTRDVPDNCLVVGPAAVVIPRSEPMNNTFIPAEKYRKLLKEHKQIKKKEEKTAEKKEEKKIEKMPAKEPQEAPVPVTVPEDAPAPAVIPAAPVLSEEQKQKLGDAIKIAYVGDLILLKDQVIKAYDREKKRYDFDRMFDHVKPYFSDADLSVGVFEGPVAGEEVGYTTSNFGDGNALYLNFPDEFAAAVKNAGIDLVTTANNHLLDRGLQGAMRTLDVLDDVGLMHTGSYRDQEEKDRLLIVEVKGVKIAVLSYLQNVNFHKADELADEEPYLTSVMPLKKFKNYDRLMKEIEADFERARNSEADMIVVMAHMGKQFSDETNAFQKKWNETFIKLGADIVLGDHVHTVQPIEYVNGALIVNCPGNFANSYIAHNGDATALVEIYIDKDQKKVIGTSVVPMYTWEESKGYFTALPIYKAMTDKAVFDDLKACEKERIKAVHEHITNVMISRGLTVEDLQDRYYYIDGQYHENKTVLLESFDRYEHKEIYGKIRAVDTVGFIGDSITEGTRNDFHPWYEMLMEHFRDKKVVNISRGGYTTTRILKEFRDDIIRSNAGLYFIALGTNDVRYRNGRNCAMTPEEYVVNIDKLVELARQGDPNAQFVLLPPWTTLENDRVSKLAHGEKLEMIDAYAEALEKYCQEHGHHYCDPNGYLREFYSRVNTAVYTKDGIHPTKVRGIDLYCKAVMENIP